MNNTEVVLSVYKELQNSGKRAPKTSAKSSLATNGLPSYHWGAGAGGGWGGRSCYTSSCSSLGILRISAVSLIGHWAHKPSFLRPTIIFHLVFVCLFLLIHASMKPISPFISSDQYARKLRRLLLLDRLVDWLCVCVPRQKKNTQSNLS